MTRRTFLGTPAASFMQIGQGEAVTRLRTRTSKEIGASRLSVGFETLDREMFDPERTYPYLGKLGVKWARCQTGWARTETEKGRYDFRWLDRVVDSLLASGIQPWFNLGYGNTLYTPGAPHPSAVGWVPLNSAEARQAWVQYVETIGRRYAGRVKHWEIWNEPNIPSFWQPDKPAPERYVELVRLTAPVLRRVVPGCVLIGGALAGFPALEYLEACCEAGLLEFVDKVSYHPYRPIPEENYEADVKAFRGTIERYRKGVGIWQGENGAPSTNDSIGALGQYEWDETRQAKWLLRRVLSDLALDVELTSYFHAVDLANYVRHTGPTGRINTKGLLRAPEYTPKLAYYAYRNVCALFDAETGIESGLLIRVEQLTAGLEPLAVRTATWRRGRSPVYAWWYPADLQKGFVSGRCRLVVWMPKQIELSQLVLVDLLHGELMVPQKMVRTGQRIVLENAPVRDYPLVLTDRAVVM